MYKHTHTRIKIETDWIFLWKSRSCKNNHNNNNEKRLMHENNIDYEKKK